MGNVKMSIILAPTSDIHFIVLDNFVASVLIVNTFVDCDCVFPQSPTSIHTHNHAII